MILKVRTCRECGCKSTDIKFLVRKNGQRENICYPCHLENWRLWYEKNRKYSSERVEAWKRANPEREIKIRQRKWLKKKRLQWGRYES